VDKMKIKRYYRWIFLSLGFALGGFLFYLKGFEYKYYYVMSMLFLIMYQCEKTEELITSGY